MTDVYLRLLKDTSKSNLITRDNYIWCPMRVGDFAKNSYMKGEGRRLYRIFQYIYAEKRLVDKNFSIHEAIKWSEIMLNFDENRWLKDNLEYYILKRYDKYLKGWPNDSADTLNFGEVMALNVFHDDGNMGNLINSLIGYNILETQPDWDSNYIYFRSVKSSELSLENKQKYVIRKSEYKWFFWMDVGGWSPHSAIVGIVTPHEVAMYDVYGSSKDIANCDRKRPSTGLASDILNSLAEALPGGAIFYQNLKNIEPIKTPVIPGDEVIFVLPDLHLHLFKGYTADNFHQPGSGKRSLDEILAKVLTVIDKYKSEKTLRIIQVGDLYELWESAMLLGIGLNPDWNCVDNTYLAAQTAYSLLSLPLQALIQRPNKEEMIKYIESIGVEAKKRKLQDVFSQPELNKLRQPWAKVKGNDVETNAAIKDVWEKMQKEIEKLHQMAFKKTNVGEFNTWGNQKTIAGNHDSFLGQIYAHEEGINNVIRFEHLHYNDEYNKPSNMRAGQFMTIINLIAETKGFGDKIKAFETSRRPDFLRDVATINWERYKKDKSMYDLIITGHTHRAYAQLIRLKMSKSSFNMQTSPEDIRYDQGWQKEITNQQYIEVYKFARKNINSILGGLAAMGWRGLATAFWLGVLGVETSKPFLDN